MYQLVQGKKSPVMFKAVKEGFSQVPKTGQNKTFLYISLIIGLIALIIGLYLLYRMNNKKTESYTPFGYNLHK